MYLGLNASIKVKYFGRELHITHVILHSCLCCDRIFAENNVSLTHAYKLSFSDITHISLLLLDYANKMLFTVCHLTP